MAWPFVVSFDDAIVGVEPMIVTRGGKTMPFDD